MLLFQFLQLTCLQVRLVQHRKAVLDIVGVLLTLLGQGLQAVPLFYRCRISLVMGGVVLAQGLVLRDGIYHLQLKIGIFYQQVRVL